MDLRQETFVAAARVWSTVLRDLLPERQKRWLHTTLQNMEKSQCRRRETERRELGLLLSLYQPTAEIPDGDRDAAFEQAAEIVKSLPARQHKIARMRWGAGMKVREIADELRIAEGTVHATLNAVRRKLAGPLERYCRPSEGGRGEAS
jgi:RNA polymerase sigma factor (sigma-70 family)